MIISIAIADTNCDYINRLANGLQQYNELDISIFTSVEMLEMALMKDRYDVVLFDSSIAEKRVQFHCQIIGYWKFFLLLV